MGILIIFANVYSKNLKHFNAINLALSTKKLVQNLRKWPWYIMWNCDVVCTDHDIEILNMNGHFSTGYGFQQHTTEHHCEVGVWNCQLTQKLTYSKIEKKCGIDILYMWRCDVVYTNHDTEIPYMNDDFSIGHGCQQELTTKHHCKVHICEIVNLFKNWQIQKLRV